MLEMQISNILKNTEIFDMFNSLKEKLKSWFSSAKTQAEKQEKKEKLAKPVKKQEKIEIIKKKEQKKHVEQEKRVEPSLRSREDITLTKEKQVEAEKRAEKEERQVEPSEKGRADTSLTTEIQPEKKSWFAKIREKFRFKITQEYFNDIFYNLELILLENNVAIKAIDSIKKELGEQLIGKEIEKNELEEEIKKALKQAIETLLIPSFDLIKEIKQAGKPFVIIFVGINGSGKTTTIAKLAYLLKKQGLKPVLAAADTFRAASIEQLSLHAEKLQIPIIKHEYGSDPASVGFDAIKYAQAHNLDVVLIDTAGRMHTKTDLIREMEKIVRVTKPNLKIFIGEAITGNDATEQAKTFNEAINIDAIILAKQDVDEKGGTAISVSKITGKPILYLGVGQEMGDLKEFNKEDVINSLGL